MTELDDISSKKDKVFRDKTLFIFMCAKMRIHNKTLVKLIIVILIDNTGGGVHIKYT